jgi:hypothetical protein
VVVPRSTLITGLTTAALTFVSVSVWALSPPHNETNSIDCGDCHHLRDNAYGFSDIVTYGKEQEAMCKTCHNPTGLAAAMSEVGTHDVATIVDCGSCHSVHFIDTTTDPHSGGVTATNLKLIRDDTSRYIPQALTPAIFQSSPDHYYFADGPATGICQTCHTQTDYYTNDGLNTDHNAGLDCTTCHAHDAGFMFPCQDCHNLAQASRRQIVENAGDGGGDFLKASHHVIGTVKDSDCTVCHYLGNHQGGTVELIDPDDGPGTIYAFNPSDPTTLGNFCVNCHDADGAGGNTTPFSDGQIVPDIDKNGVWAASAHSTGGGTNSGYSSCYGDGTNGCHSNGHGSNLAKLLAPDNGSPGTDNVNQEEGFCYGCHNSAGVINEAVANAWIGGVYQNYADDIESAFGQHSTHPVNDSAAGHTFDLGQGAGPQELECTSCHGVHSSTGKYWDAPFDDTPVIKYATTELWGDNVGEKIGQYDPADIYQAPSIGEAGLNVAGDPLPIDGAGDSLLIDTVRPDYNRMCLECHQYAVGSSIALDYPNQDHGSENAEPVGEAGVDATGVDLVPPFNSASRGQYYLDCLDCHEAHGSENGWLIRQSSNGQVVTSLIRNGDSIEWSTFCNNCHSSVPLEKHHTNDIFAKIGGPTCASCHDVHDPSAYLSCIKSGCHGHNDRF